MAPHNLPGQSHSSCCWWFAILWSRGRGMHRNIERTSEKLIFVPITTITQKSVLRLEHTKKVFPLLLGNSFHWCLWRTVLYSTYFMRFHFMLPQGVMRMIWKFAFMVYCTVTFLLTVKKGWLFSFYQALKYFFLFMIHIFMGQDHNKHRIFERGENFLQNV